MTAKAYQAKRPVAQLVAGGTANRLVTTTDGLTMAMAQATASMLGPGAVPRMATKIVAASNASAAMLAAADYVCDGAATNNDQVEISAALASLPLAGGTVLLSEGTFHLSGGITVSGARVVLRGLSMDATTLRFINGGGAGINTAMITLTGDYAEVSDLAVDGNKTNNPGTTVMVGVSATSAASPRVERVHIKDIGNYGMATGTATANGVIRDCLVENSGYGYAMRATAGQPLVVSGCTAKNNPNAGFWLDYGPSVISDCIALGNTGVGFGAVSTGIPTLINCTAQSNGSYGFSISVAGIQCVGCTAISNTNGGFITTGAQTVFEGCSAQMASNGHAFTSDVGATDTLYSGCVARDTLATYACFYHNSAGKSTYIGCQALNSQSSGFRANAGEIHVRGCYVYGTLASLGGIRFSGGANHVVDGCRIINNGGSGILVETPVPNVQVTNNFVSNSSTSGNSSYNQISVSGDTAFVHGNMLRDPPSGNRPWGGIVIESGSDDSFVGLNNTAGTGTAAEVYGVAATTRQVAKLQLDYTTTTDLLPSTALTAGVWIDVIPDQTFRVDSPTSVVEISCWGTMTVSSLPSPAITSTQLIIDALLASPQTRLLGVEHMETTNGPQNPMAGAAPIKLTGMAVGNHTVKFQVRTNSTSGVAQLIAATTPTNHAVMIQVMEYAR